MTTSVLEPQRQLASDLAEMLRFSGYHPDVAYMAELILKAFNEGRYSRPSPADQRTAREVVCHKWTCGVSLGEAKSHSALCRLLTTTVDNYVAAIMAAARASRPVAPIPEEGTK